MANGINKDEAGKGRYMMFRKDPNLVAYNKGRRPITSVIKNTGPAEALIFRLPEEDFNTNSTLVVMPGEEAIFIDQGHISQSFTPGTYPLNTKNYPFITKMRNIVSGGVSVFNCVVVFVRTSSSRQIEWGDRFSMRDPVLGIQTDIGTGGAYRTRVGDAGMLMIKILGSTQREITESGLNDYFSSVISMRIKSQVIKMIQESQLEVLGIEQNLALFSECVEKYMSVEFAKHGLDLQSFTIDRLVILDSKVRDKMEAYFGENVSMNKMGHNWSRHVLSRALNALSKNEGAGGFASAAAGLGLGMSTMPAFSSIIQEIVSNSPNSNSQGILGGIINSVPGNNGVDTVPQPPGFGYMAASDSTSDTPQNASIRCINCGNNNPAGSRFCGECGKSLSPDIVCPSCNQKIPHGKKYCTNCGNEL